MIEIVKTPVSKTRKRRKSAEHKPCILDNQQQPHRTRNGRGVVERLIRRR